LRHKVNEVFNKINKWFHCSSLRLNYDKTYYLKFHTKANKENNTKILHSNKTTATTKSITFLGLTLDTTLNWKQHISELIPRLNKACYAIRAIRPFMSLAVLKNMYFSYAHSIMTYGLIFWGNSTESNDIFKIQKRIIRIIMNPNENASCRELFKKLKILPLQSQYIYSIFLYIIKNKDQFSLNSNIHTINSRHSNNLHVPPANLTIYQKGVYYSGIRIFNHLPQTIKNLSDNKKKIPNCTKKVPFKQFIF
jgi:hypothetical protein